MLRLRPILALTLAAVLPAALVNACTDDSVVIPDTPDSGGAPSVDGGPGIDARPVDPGRDARAEDDSSGPVCPIDMNATVTATIKVTADDYLRLWVNGTLVDDKLTTWGTVDTRDVTLFRHPSRKNVIAVEARNAFNTGGYDRGLLLDLGFDAGADAAPDSGVPGIVTDPTWKIVGTHHDAGLPDGGLPDGSAGAVGWFSPDFDDSAWFGPYDEGPHGMAPWGNVFGQSSARWLWSYDSSTAASKPADEFVYFRKTFYLDVGGAPSDTPPGCP